MLKEVSQVEGRSVVFTTHYLEEADMLADRKVILAGGTVITCGTSSELKRLWGDGYWLNLSVDKNGDVSRQQARKLLRKIGKEIIAPCLVETEKEESDDAQDQYGY